MAQEQRWMAGRDVVVVGGSAGALEALRELVGRLPAGLPAAVLVTFHLPAGRRSRMPAILGRSGPLAAGHGHDGEPLLPGRIYVAPPDRHLLVLDGRIRLGAGPREHGFRPAVDPLFRSAASAYGERVVAVVLSGMLDDGTAGLLAVKRRGGVAVVQDPAEARYDGMPTSAIRHVAVDHVRPVAGIATLLVELTTRSGEEQPMGSGNDGDELEREVALSLSATGVPSSRPGEGWVPSAFSCPDCNGVLWARRDGELDRWRCRVGHQFSPQSLAHHQADRIDGALWALLKDVEEQAEFTGRMSQAAAEHGHRRDARYWRRQAERAEQTAAKLRGMLTDRAAGQDAQRGAGEGAADQPAR
jgi:two-component system chemotaxis response regulator CheB